MHVHGYIQCPEDRLHSCQESGLFDLFDTSPSTAWLKSFKAGNSHEFITALSRKCKNQSESPTWGPSRTALVSYKVWFRCFVRNTGLQRHLVQNCCMKTNQISKAQRFRLLAQIRFLDSKRPREIRSKPHLKCDSYQISKDSVIVCTLWGLKRRTLSYRRSIDTVDCPTVGILLQRPRQMVWTGCRNPIRSLANISVYICLSYLIRLQSEQPWTEPNTWVLLKVEEGCYICCLMSRVFHVLPCAKSFAHTTD